MRGRGMVWVRWTRGSAVDRVTYWSGEPYVETTLWDERLDAPVVVD